MSADEEEVVRGLLPFTINGEERLVPELKWRANREWQERLEAGIIALANTRTDTPEGVRAMSDTERELVLAYDAGSCPDYKPGVVPRCHPGHALGDLEDATERDIDVIYDKLLEVAYPKAASQTALVLTIIRRAVESASQNSSSGPLPSGISALTTSSKPSPTARSSSTTRRRKRA
jgi:hypothetical protein